MLPLLLFLVISCFPYTHAIKANINSEGVLYLNDIDSPIDYSSVVKERSIKKIEISRTNFTEEIIDDLAIRFLAWKDLHSISVLHCFFTEESATSLARILTSNPHINEVKIHFERGIFIALFLEQLLKVPAYLKKLEIAIHPDYQHSSLINEPGKLRTALSTVEHVSFDFSAAIVNFEPGTSFIVTNENQNFDEIERIHEFDGFDDVDLRLFCTLIANMHNLRLFDLKASQTSSLCFMQLLLFPEKIEYLNVTMNQKTFDPAMEEIVKMKNLKEFWIHPQYSQTNDSQLISVLQTLPIEKLHIEGRMDVEYFENFLPIKTLKQLSINLNGIGLPNITQLTFTASLDEFPFEIQGNYDNQPVQWCPKQHQSLNQILCCGIKTLKITPDSNDAFIEEFNQWLLNGNGGEIEEFEIDANRMPLHNFDACLALMPNLKKLSILNTNERDQNVLPIGFLVDENFIRRN